MLSFVLGFLQGGAVCSAFLASASASAVGGQLVQLIFRRLQAPRI